MKIKTYHFMKNNKLVIHSGELDQGIPKGSQLNRKSKRITSLALLMFVFSMLHFNPVNAQYSFSGSQQGYNKDCFVINQDANNYWSYLRLQAGGQGGSLAYGWNMVNEGNLWWGYVGSSDFGNTGNRLMTLTQEGRLRIGTNENSDYKLDVGGSMHANSITTEHLEIGYFIYPHPNNPSLAVSGNVYAEGDIQATGNITVDAGYVSIGADYVSIGAGTNQTDYRLAVEGTIGARAIEVTTEAWPDFVFKDGYALRSLEEVEAYVKDNHHLPDVPSEAEIKEKGHDLGKMNAVLLQKIEELTLYVIDLQKEVERLKTAVDPAKR